MPLDDLNQDMSALLLSLAQGDSPPVHAPRVTESLIRYGVTESWSYYKDREQA
jgi:predicted component of type VI protein secretion system